MTKYCKRLAEPLLEQILLPKSIYLKTRKSVSSETTWHFKARMHRRTSGNQAKSNLFKGFSVVCGRTDRLRSSDFLGNLRPNTRPGGCKNIGTAHTFYLFSEGFTWPRRTIQGCVGYWCQHFWKESILKDEICLFNEDKGFISLDQSSLWETVCSALLRETNYNEWWVWLQIRLLSSVYKRVENIRIFIRWKLKDY